MKENNVFDAIETPAGLEARLEALIDGLAEKENQKEKKIRQLRRWSGGLAAGIAILLSIGIFLHFNKQEPLTAYTSEEQQMAYLEAQKALVLVSLNFNKGVDQVAPAMDKVEKSYSIINKTLKR